MSPLPNRHLGTYTQHRPGPLVVVLGAMHGNEPAGVAAVAEVLRLLEVEPATTPDFVFYGRLVGLLGNRAAFAQELRFVQEDFNRIWYPGVVDETFATSPEERRDERRELAELLTTIRTEINDYQPDTLVVLDLHTTSAEGGIFSIPLEGDAASLTLARQLHAPVVLGLLQGLGGTLLHFAAGNQFATDSGYPRHTCSVAFEAGQHHDPASVSRAAAAIVNCLRAVGCIRPTDVDSLHDDLLRDYTATLPKVTRLRYVHHLHPDDDFRMRPGYLNFQEIQEGEHLADDVRGPVLAPDEGLVLMPLYQPKGSDGFFIVEDIS